jgi:hypothetical protein
MATIINKVTNCETIPWSELKTYEFNTLKDTQNRDVSKLKNSIVNNGFNSPFYIWNEHRLVLDGTGRNLALLELEKEGFKIPDLPIVKIQAENKKEAIKIVLQINSQHGQITQASLSDFTSVDFEIKELKQLQIEELNMPVLDLVIESLHPAGDPDIDFDDIESTENRSKQFKTQNVTCPECGNHFQIQI